MTRNTNLYSLSPVKSSGWYILYVLLSCRATWYHTVRTGLPQPLDRICGHALRRALRQEHIFHPLASQLVAKRLLHDDLARWHHIRRVLGQPSEQNEACTFVLRLTVLTHPVPRGRTPFPPQHWVATCTLLDSESSR